MSESITKGSSKDASASETSQFLLNFDVCVVISLVVPPDTKVSSPHSAIRLQSTAHFWKCVLVHFWNGIIRGMEIDLPLLGFCVL